MPTPLIGEWPSNFLEIISNLTQETYQTPSKPKFHFTRTMEAAKHNWEIITQYRHLGEALDSQQNSILRYGSEFRPVQSLQPLLEHHPLWPRLKISLSSGVQFPLYDTTSEEKKYDVKEALKFGNHKGAQKYKSFFTKCLDEDFRHGYSLVIPRLAILKIPNALLAPLNVVDQNTINEHGEIIDKKRLTHNQSMVFPGSNTSVNGRLKHTELQDCMYGHCLLRIIHTIVFLRTKHPKTMIFMSKIDFKSAYRRLHYAWQTAIQSATCHEDLSFIAL